MLKRQVLGKYVECSSPRVVSLSMLNVVLQPKIGAAPRSDTAANNRLAVPGHKTIRGDGDYRQPGTGELPDIFGAFNQGTTTPSPACQIFPQFLPHLEIRQLFGFHVNRYAGLRVAPGVRLVFANSKTAEAADLDPATFTKCFGHGRKHGVDYHFSLVQGQTSPSSQRCSQFRFGHLLPRGSFGRSC